MLPAVLLVPGLYDSGPRHWQSLWGAEHPEFGRAVQRDWVNARRHEWVETLQQAIVRMGGPTVLAGHSLACATIAHWARTHPTGAVVGALLAAPADVDRPSFPATAQGFAPMPLDRLPFPGTVVASSDDEYVTAERARRFARAWGSRLVEVGAAGHLNTDAGHGPWPVGWALLHELRAAAAVG